MHKRSLGHVITRFENNRREENQEKRRWIEKAFNDVDVFIIVAAEIPGAVNKSADCKAERHEKTAIWHFWAANIRIGEDYLKEDGWSVIQKLSDKNLPGR